MSEYLGFLEKVDFLRSAFLGCLALLLIFNLFLVIHYLYRRKRPLEGEPSRLSRFLRFGFLTTIAGTIILNGLLFFGGVGLGASLVVPEPKVISPKDPSLTATDISPQKPFRIIFDRPIDTGSLTKTISPDLEGSWKFESTNFPYFSDTLVFVPRFSPTPESRYTISLSGIKNVAGIKTSEYLLSFMAPPLPSVKSITPVNGAEGVVPNQEIIVETDFLHDDTARLDFHFKPEVSLTIRKEGAKYYLKAKDGFKKSTTYSLEVYRTPVSRDYATNELKDAAEAALIAQSNFRTVEAPGVADYGPKGTGIMTDSQIWVNFKQDMDKASTENAFSVNPAITGTKKWESNRKLVFSPASPLSKDTSYKISVAATAKMIDGASLANEFSFSFVTIGPVVVSSFNPGNNASSVDLAANISVRFNQAVDHTSAQSHFSISPNVAGSFSWSGSTMIFTHGSFGYSTRYTFGVTSGIKSVYGLDSVKGFASTFVTRQQSVMLNVPSYRQSHMYSCMASAARSALAYKGAFVGENRLLDLMTYDRTAFSGVWRGSNAIWGNPYNAIVGNVDGRSGGVNWGYGAYWGPTARAISVYRPADIKTGWNTSGIASEISKGNPVLVWWVNGVWPAYEVYWKTPTGTRIRGVNSMHVQVVKGFTGSVSNPTSFTVVDSGYGYPARTYDIGTFKAKWSWFGNSAVVVR